MREEDGLLVKITRWCGGRCNPGGRQQGGGKLGVVQCLETGADDGWVDEQVWGGIFEELDNCLDGVREMMDNGSQLYWHWM